MNNKTIFSKFNTVGAIRQSAEANKLFKNVLTGKQKSAGCSDISDTLTTYVSQKVWDEIIKDYIYPPYVDCGYVE